MALGTTSEHSLYHYTCMMNHSKSDRIRKASTESESKTPPIEDHASLLYAMQSTFRQKLAMQRNTKKINIRTKHKHIDNETSLLELCEKSKKMVKGYIENHKENTNKLAMVSNANAKKKLPPISIQHDGDHNNNLNSQADLNKKTLSKKPSIITGAGLISKNLQSSGFTGSNSAMTAQARMYNKTGTETNSNSTRKIDDSPPDMTKLHLVRNKKRSELIKFNTKHSSPTNLSDQEFQQSQVDLHKLHPDLNKLKTNGLTKRGNKATLQATPVTGINDSCVEPSVTDFQKWQMEQDKFRQNRIEKYRNALKQKSENRPGIGTAFNQPLQSIHSNAEELKHVSTKVLRKNVKRKQSIIASPSYQHSSDSDHSMQVTKQNKKEGDTKPKRLSPDMRGLTAYSTRNGSPVYPFNATIPGLHKPVLVRHDGRSNTSSRTSTRNTFYSTAKIIPPMEGTKANYDKNLLVDGDSSGIPEQESVVLCPCNICGRKFAAERIDKHMTICAKASNKKRKIFNMSKARKKGTDLEKFTPVKAGYATHEQAHNKKNNWRSQHEEFINTIRHAKMVQSHVNKGGRIADLPPPEPSANANYVTCDYCQRRFAPQVAERHIPRCKDIKARPPPPKSRYAKSKR